MRFLFLVFVLIYLLFIISFDCYLPVQSIIFMIYTSVAVYMGACGCGVAGRCQLVRRWCNKFPIRAVPSAMPIEIVV